MTQLTLRIEFDDSRALGPGKIRLLEPVVETRGGGVGGGGASLTPFGISLVADYRAMKQDARDALARRLAELVSALAPGA